MGRALRDGVAPLASRVTAAAAAAARTKPRCAGWRAHSGTGGTSAKRLAADGTTVAAPAAPAVGAAATGAVDTAVDADARDEVIVGPRLVDTGRGASAGPGRAAPADGATDVIPAAAGARAAAVGARGGGGAPAAVAADGGTAMAGGRGRAAAVPVAGRAACAGGCGGGAAMPALLATTP